MKFFPLIFMLIIFTHAQVNLEIQNERGLTPCQNGYFWTSQSCMQCKFIQNGYCICQSYLQCDSIHCNTNYKLNTNNQCLQQLECEIGCNKCGFNQNNNAIVCFECDHNYTLLAGICILSNSCIEYNAQTGQCKKCINSYFNWDLQQLNPDQSQPYYTNFVNTCTQCSIQNCLFCDSLNTCKECLSGYEWKIVDNIGQCVQILVKSCGDYCQQCDSKEGSCYYCQDNAYLNQQNQCDLCSESQIIINAQACLRCQDQYICTQCKEQYVLTKDGCDECPKNCLLCIDISRCINCYDGYILNENGNCYKYIDGCKENVFIDNSTTVTCNQCQDTYYREYISSQLYHCELCNDKLHNSIRCNGEYDKPQQIPLQPTQCVNGYFLVFNQFDQINECIKQEVNNTCYQLESIYNNDCKECLPGFIKMNDLCVKCTISDCYQCANKNDLMICEFCNDGYYKASDQQCTQCSSNCNKCIDGQTCIDCQDYYFIEETGLCTLCSTVNCIICPNDDCQLCKQSYFVTTVDDKKACNKCPEDCLNCQDPGNSCSQCPDNYIKQGDGCVSLQNSNCYKYEDEQCSICQYGYYLSNGKCLQCINPESASVCRKNEQQILNPDNKDSNPNLHPDNNEEENTQKYSLSIAIFIIILTVVI